MWQSWLSWQIIFEFGKEYYLQESKIDWNIAGLSIIILSIKSRISEISSERFDTWFDMDKTLIGVLLFQHQVMK